MTIPKYRFADQPLECIAKDGSCDLSEVQDRRQVGENGVDGIEYRVSQASCRSNFVVITMMGNSKWQTGGDVGHLTPSARPSSCPSSFSL